MIPCAAGVIVAAEKPTEFWSFYPPVRTAAPRVRSTDRVRNPIDAFVLSTLEAKGLTLSDDADQLTLLRRACFDLLGLPPTLEQIREFIADERPGAYERLIDRLLASPHYGERWGRHWLDIAGYADSEGILDEDRVRTAAWRYRDYVIAAFNKDKPYDRFLQEQIAGDELVDYWTAYRTQTHLDAEVIESLIATGYLRCASDASRPDFLKLSDRAGYYYQTLDDTLKMVSSATLGLTVQCAKCHDHKTDPIPQVDYYRLQAIFMSAYRPGQWIAEADRRLYEASEAQVKERNAGTDRARATIESWRKQYADRLYRDRLAELPEADRSVVAVALETHPARRTDIQKELAARHEPVLIPDSKKLDETLSAKYPVFKTRLASLQELLKIAEKRTKGSFSEIRAVYDLPGQPQTHLLQRGDPGSPGPAVDPGALSAVVAPQPFSWTPPAADAPTSGRRLAFAKWLTQPDHPLTARVMVNRLWLHHFGQGIVNTPDDFGRSGSLPSHPELLDWLATEFVRRGWSIKEMHRIIMTSSTYRQRAGSDPRHARARELDPGNQLLWRQRVRRLDAEALRDAVLDVAGNLNRQRLGSPVPVQRQPDGEVIVQGPAGARRSIYLQVRRSQPVSFLQIFDQPVMQTNCTQRMTSIVSSQALTLLNSDFMAEQAAAFAERSLREGGEDPVFFIMEVATGRPPDAEEHARLTALLKQQQRLHQVEVGTRPDTPIAVEQESRRRAIIDLCHTVLSSNPFIFID